MAGVRRSLPLPIVEAVRLASEGASVDFGAAVAQLSKEEVRQTQLAIVSRFGSVYCDFYDLTGVWVPFTNDIAGAVLAACGTGPPWSVDELDDLLRLVGDPWEPKDRSVAPVVMRALEDVPRPPPAVLEVELLGALSVCAEWDAAFVAALRALLPESTPLHAALAGIEPSDLWGRRVRVEARRLDLDPAAAVIALSTARAVGSGTKRHWQPGFETAASTAGVADFLGMLVRTVLTVDTPPGSLPFDPRTSNEKIAAGAATLLGYCSRLTSDAGNRSQSVDLLERVGFWGARWAGNRPVSNPVVRGAVAGLVEIGDNPAVVALHRLRERFGDRAGLIKPVIAALDTLLAGRSIAQLLADTGPDFGLGAAGCRTWETDRGCVELVVRALGVEVEERFATDQIGRGAVSHEAALDTARQLAVTVSREFAVVTRRLEQHLRELTAFAPAEYVALVDHNPLMSVVARSLLWRYRFGEDWLIGLPLAGGKARTPGDGNDIDGWTEATLWHPLLSEVGELEALRRWAFEAEFDQTIRQIFRDTHAVGDDVVGRVPLRTSKVEALLRQRRWKMTAIGGWDGGQVGTAVRRDPATGFAVYATIDSPWLDDDGPRRGGSWCTLTDVLVDAGRLDPTGDHYAVLASEALRDLELAAVAAAPSRRDVEPLAAIGVDFRAASAVEPLRGSGRVRRDVVELLLAGPLADARLYLTECHLAANGAGGPRLIHLGNATVIGPNNEIIGARPSGTVDLPWLPFETNGTLAWILRIALTAQPMTG